MRENQVPSREDVPGPGRRKLRFRPRCLRSGAQLVVGQRPGRSGQQRTAFDVGLSGEPIPGTTESSLVGRLPDDLRGTADDVRFESVPFVPLYKIEDELAAEVSNKTVHGVMHLGWARQEDGTYQGQMAVYVKPRGAFGRAYMAFIKPFRYLVVYPALEKQLARTWVRQG